ncbi:MAG: methylmalonyl-CoA mutase family protein, partial [Bacteroidota bacterium]
MNRILPYQPTHKVRIVTAASLFDGHDAAINIMRRILQASGAEIIHLGHNRAARDIVETAIQEDAQAIAITSYQGGHLEYFKYMYDLLLERECGHIKLFGGGGGTILPSEIEELHAYGIARIYSPDDGRELGLQGMINDLLQQADFPTGKLEVDKWKSAIAEAYGDVGNNGTAILTKVRKRISSRSLGRLISSVENSPELVEPIMDEVHDRMKDLVMPPILGITGTGGAGKSSLVDELVRRFLMDFPEKHIAIVSVDPSKRKTGGALLGDRIRMNAVYDERVYMRSLATRQSNLALSKHIPEVLNILKAAQFDMIILETSGIGQSDTEIVDHSDLSLYIMTPEYGAATQLEKIDMLDYADLIAINKFDKRGAKDALRDVCKQYKRNHMLFDKADDEMPIFGTIASKFNDPGMNRLYRGLMNALAERTNADLKTDFLVTDEASEKIYIIPPARTRYLSEISESIRKYGAYTDTQADLAQQLQSLHESIELLKANQVGESEQTALRETYDALNLKLDKANQQIIESWPEKVARYQADEFVYQVRKRDISVSTKHLSLSGNKIPKVSMPRYRSWGDILRWSLQENVPGEFPYTAGVFPFKREGEDPTRMFAGEGGPERTNKRFHYVSLGMPAKRLSTAFDSVTLYGEDPDFRPDIYGKIGNSGVSICNLDDAKKLYSGFNLCDKATSVSMTINGPAATVLGFFLNTAIDQQCELYIKEQGLESEVEAKIEAIYAEKGVKRPRYQGELPEGNDGLGLMLLGVTGDQVLEQEVYDRIRAEALSKVRGTVQADILKEDQAQNTCIFSTEFSLKLMGDVQQYFIDHLVRNFYSVS